MSTLETQQYSSKPRFVEAIQVTPENMVNVANWCDGQIHLEDSSTTWVELPTLEALAKAFIKVKVTNPRFPRQSEAHVGDWVLKMGNSFKVFMNAPFHKNYNRVQPTAELEDIGTPLYEQIFNELQVARATQMPNETLAQRLERLYDLHNVEPVTPTEIMGRPYVTEVPTSFVENPDLIKNLPGFAGEGQRTFDEILEDPTGILPDEPPFPQSGN